MNSSQIGRIVWKEYRQQRSLFLSVVCLSILSQLAVATISAATGKDLPIEGLFVIGLGMPALYALGCGALLFAGEDEASTIGYLRSIPVSSRELLIGKVGFAVVSTLLLMPVLWLATLAVTQGRVPNPLEHVRIWLICSVGWIEVLAWSVLCSLVVRRVLWATLVAGCAAAHVAVVWYYISGGHALEADAANIRTLPLHVATVFALTTAAVYASRRWLDEWTMALRLPWRTSAYRPRDVREAKPARRSSHFASEWAWQEISQWTTVRFIQQLLSTGRKSFSTCQRLVYLERRQSVATRWLLLSAAIACGTFFVATNALRADGYKTLLLVLAPLAAIMGTCVFAGDQRRGGFRFFCEHGIQPRMVWLSRQLVWVGWLAIPVLALCSVNALYPQGSAGWMAAVVGQVILFYAMGQACSLFVRSLLLAIVATVAGCVVVTLWQALIADLRFSVSWAVWPIPLILLLATWLRMSDWIAERSTWRAKLRAIGSVAIPGLVLLVSIGIHRATEIPRTPLPYDRADIERAPTDEERQAVERYADAWRQLQTPDPAEASRWNSPAEGFLPLIAATRQTVCRFADQGELELAGSNVMPYWFAIHYAKVLREEGKLNADEELEIYWALLRMAGHMYSQPSFEGYLRGRDIESLVLERLPRWAARSGKSSQQIIDILAQLEIELKRIEPDWDLAVGSEYCRYRRLVKLDPETVAETLGPSYQNLRYVAWLGRWEQMRMLRLVDLLAAKDLQRFHTQWKLLEQGGTVKKNLTQEVTDKHIENTPLMRGWHGTRIAFWELGNCATRRRAARIQMALAAWQMEHHELPATLDDLVHHGLASVPQDPYSGRPFHYVPGGGFVRNRDTSTYERGPPALWSHRNLAVEIHAPESDPNNWMAGDDFPIPIVAWDTER